MHDTSFSTLEKKKTGTSLEEKKPSTGSWNMDQESESLLLIARKRFILEIEEAGEVRMWHDSWYELKGKRFIS